MVARSFLRRSIFASISSISRAGHQGLRLELGKSLRGLRCGTRANYLNGFNVGGAGPALFIYVQLHSVGTFLDRTNHVFYCRNHLFYLAYFSGAGPWTCESGAKAFLIFSAACLAIRRRSAFLV